MRIDIRMIGAPQVQCDGKTIHFKYQKAEAVFYYIALHRCVERNKAMGIFWPEEPEDKARKNLRNALYSIRQVFDTEIIRNMGQRLICFTEQVTLTTDCDFLKGEMTCGNPGSGDFLGDFILKDTPDFDLWVSQTREEIKEARMIRLRQNFLQTLASGKNPEDLGKELLNLDPFDEVTCRHLIAYYDKAGQYSRCMELYSRLCRVLEAELSLKPEPETTRLFQDILESRRIRKTGSDSPRAFFFGREAELERMSDFNRKVLADSRPGLVLISGEAGIGKTTVIRRFLEGEQNREIMRIGISCHDGDEHHFLKVWYPVILKIGEILIEKGLHPGTHQKEILSRVFPTFMNTHMAEKSYQMEKLEQIPLPVILKMTVDTLALALEAHSMIIFIEDIQWIDRWSLELLKHLVMETKSGELLFLASYRNSDCGELDQFVAELHRQDRILNLELPRFSKAETDSFISGFPGQLTVNREIRESVYEESEGNALMLTEILKSLAERGSYETIPTKVRTIFSSRYQSLGSEARKLADLISTFSEPAAWEDLKSIHGKAELELLEIIEELIRRQFIFETNSGMGDLRYQYSHQKLKEFVYNSQSGTKRKLIHKRIGDRYREMLTSTPADRLLYPKLIFHYGRSSERVLQLEFRIRKLYDYLEISHELFPRIKDKTMIPFSQQQDYSDDFILREIKAIETVMMALSGENSTRQLELQYLNMVSRYHILQGNVQTGCDLSKKMIDLAEETGQREFILKGFLQLIFNAINQRDTPEMDALLQQVFKHIKTGTDKGEMGVFIRLKGYLMILKSRFVQGEALLLSSAKIFERPEYLEAYVLNRIAAYFYLGESRRLQSDYAGAIQWYREAEALCRDQGFSSHLGMVLSSIGISSYDHGHLQNAEVYLRQAVELYETIPFKWGQVSAYAYWGLVCLRKGLYSECLKYIKKADQHAMGIGHAYEAGLMLRIKAEICCILKTVGGNKGLEDYLSLSTSSYCTEAVDFFSNHPSFTYEEKLLSDLNRICSKCVDHR